MLSTDQPVYPIWRLGGTVNVNVNVTQLSVNASYYLWLQGPTDSGSKFTGSKVQNTRAGGLTSVPLKIPSTAPPGTYAVTLSNSNQSDTRQAIAHFGLFGTDNGNYTRTQTVLIAGGGFAPSSLVTITVRSGAQALGGFPHNVTTHRAGDFNYTFMIPPSTRTGVLSITASGGTFDRATVFSLNTAVNISPTPIKITSASDPPNSVERTSQASVSYQIKYATGVPVTTALNSTRVSVTRVDNAQVITQLPLTLTDAATGTWKAVWAPKASEDTTRFRFDLARASFDDSYGNLGQGTLLSSSEFAVRPARLDLAFQTNSTLQRTETAKIVILVKYHDGSNFANVTQTASSVTQADRNTIPMKLIFNSTLNQFAENFTVPVGAPLGIWHVDANVRDAYGNTGTGTYDILIQKAVMKYAVISPTTAERTTAITVNATLTYPDGSVISSGQLTPGVNATMTIGNFTWSKIMDYDAATAQWRAAYVIPQNATLGDYSIALAAQDSFENGGNFSTSAKVIPARFRILAPPNSKTSPKQIVNIAVFVRYPNGSSLPSGVGAVTASYTNSSGNFNAPMFYNATDQRWHLLFLAPDTGISFGVTITFSFDAKDNFGNAGSASKVYDLAVGAGTQALILAVIAGAIVPASLVGWALVTISARRRKHKP